LSFLVTGKTSLRFSKIKIKLSELLVKIKNERWKERKRKRKKEIEKEIKRKKYYVSWYGRLALVLYFSLFFSEADTRGNPLKE
jgi:hypothetical protein